MAPRTLVKRTTFILLWLSSIVVISNAKETHMVFYLQDVAGGNNATVIPVASRNASSTSVFLFGAVRVIDDRVTEGPELNSPQVARAQGIYVNSALDGSNFHLVCSIVFTNAKYNGSTLEIYGADRYLLDKREVAVVSGTGAFRFASGFAVLETAVLDRTKATVRFSVTIHH